ncbi:MAG TPA: flagellin [Vicinamibacterales bacterium]|nr:flagellin [Vicinamibacterales bacterium]
MASFSVVSNIASANAQANLQMTNIGLNKALNRLSSGYRINSSGDDAAGLAVANTYRNDQAILNQGIRNANDGLSNLQIKDGALGNISTILDRLATLATQASSSSNGADITKLSDEYNSMLSEIDREATVAGLGSSSSFSVFVSSESTASDGAVTDTIGAADSSTLGLTTTSFSTAAQAQTALGEVQDAISSLGDVQNTVGTLENRLGFAISLATSQTTNKQAAESRIRDANVAQESANMTRYNILSQAGVAALSQANQASASVLALLR